MLMFPERGGPHLLWLFLAWCPLVTACPPLCTCYRAPLTVSCQSQGFSRVPLALPPASARLFLQNNRITELTAGVFPPNVSILWLYSNNLSRIAAGALNGLARLEELDLGENLNLRSLDQGTFWGLEGLQTLHLHRCGLTSLPDGLFRKLYALQYLYLQENQISNLQGNLFLDLANLSYLFLHGNRIRTLASNAFRGLVNLDRLLLHQNLLTGIQRPAFRDLGQLATLFLFDNGLSELPGSALLPLASLRFLRLNGNPWACDCRARSLWRWFASFPGASSAVTCASPPGRRGRDLRLLTLEDFRECPAGPEQGSRGRWTLGEAGGAVAPKGAPPSPAKEPWGPGNVTEGARLNDSPGKAGPRSEYWPDYYDDGDLTSDTPGGCAGGAGNCRSPAAIPQLAFHIVPFPIWALAVLQWM